MAGFSGEGSAETFRLCETLVSGSVRVRGIRFGQNSKRLSFMLLLSLATSRSKSLPASTATGLSCLYHRNRFSRAGRVVLLFRSGSLLFRHVLGHLTFVGLRDQVHGEEGEGRHREYVEGDRE